MSEVVLEQQIVVQFVNFDPIVQIHFDLLSALLRASQEGMCTNLLVVLEASMS